MCVNMHIQRIRIINLDQQWKIVRMIYMTIIAYCIRDRVGNDPNCGIFAVFDGHGGKQVAEHLKERMPDELKREISKTPGDLCHMIESTFLKVLFLNSNILA